MGTSHPTLATEFASPPFPALTALVLDFASLPRNNSSRSSVRFSAFADVHVPCADAGCVSSAGRTDIYHQNCLDPMASQQRRRSASELRQTLLPMSLYQNINTECFFFYYYWVYLCLRLSIGALGVIIYALGKFAEDGCGRGSAHGVQVCNLFSKQSNIRNIHTEERVCPLWEDTLAPPDRHNTGAEARPGELSRRPEGHGVEISPYTAMAATRENHPTERMSSAGRRREGRAMKGAACWKLINI